MKQRFKPYLRHRWSHRNSLHRFLVRRMNRFISIVPDKVKYGLNVTLKRSNPPYNLLCNGSIVVQIGAPGDTLMAGRSRTASYSYIVGDRGKVIVVEPDHESVALLRTWYTKNNINNIFVIEKGAWSENTELAMYIDHRHPATNFTEGTVNYSESRLKDFKRVVVPVVTVDSCIEKMKLPRLDLISITTNGSETKILEGAKNLITKYEPAIALACTSEKNHEVMEYLGYTRWAADDRGFTYIKD